MGYSHCNFSTFFFSSSAVSLLPSLSDTSERNGVILNVHYLSFEFLWFDVEKVEKGVIQIISGSSHYGKTTVLSSEAIIKSTEIERILCKEVAPAFIYSSLWW